MEAILDVPPPLDLTRTFSRFRTWGEDPVNRLGDGVLRRAVRVGEGWHGYELRWTGEPDDPRITVRVPGARRPAVLAAAVAEARRICGADLDLGGLLHRGQGGPGAGGSGGAAPRAAADSDAGALRDAGGLDLRAAGEPHLRVLAARRLVRRFGSCLRVGGETVYVFPEPAVLARARVSQLRAMKFSGRKAEYIIGSRAPSRPAPWISPRWPSDPTRRSSRRSPPSAGSGAGRRSGFWRAASAAGTSAPPATSRCERRSSISTTGAGG